MTESELTSASLFLQPTLALTGRAMTTEARMWRTYIFRSFFLCVILLNIGSFHVRSALMGAAGLQFFRSMMNTNMIFVSLLAIAYISSAIAEEKEEMTLGLLRMTLLDPISILLGKGFTRLAGVGTLIVAQIPFTLMAITMGGISLRQILASYATLLGYLILLTGIAVFSSVISRKSADAAGMTLLLALVVLLGPFVLHLAVYLMSRARIWDLSGWISWPIQVLENTSPFAQLGRIMRTGYSDFPIGFQAISNIVIGVLFFLLAWRVFEFFTREQKDATPSRALLSRGRKWRYFNPGPAWDRALVWKDFNFIMGGTGGIVTRCIGYSAVIVGISALFVWLEDPRGRLSFFTEVFPIVAGITTTGILALELLNAASRVFNSETAWGTLSSLSTLPMTVTTIALEKVRGCLLGIIPAFSFWMLLAPTWVPRFFRGNTDFSIILPAILDVVAHFIFVLVLTALLSLYIKHGAWAVALVILAFVAPPLNIIIALTAMPLGGMIGPYIAMYLTIITLGVLTAIALAITMARFKALAYK